jgi:putative DNA primase/helicase
MFNHQPRSRDHSTGFWRRVRLIPFTKQFAGGSADKNLDAKLAAEREGILAWAVRACLEWQREGLSVPQAVLDASQQYQRDEDPLHGFIQQYVKRDDGSKFKLKHAFGLYVRWCKDEHITGALGRNRFGTLLESHGFKRFDPDGTAWYRGGRLTYTCVCRQPEHQCTCI